MISIRPVKSFLNKAFTLTEVSLAVGMAAFGMLSVVALMPVAFDMLEESGTSGVEARIGSQITDELKAIEFSEIQSLSGDRRLYNLDGLELEDGNRADAHFVALITVDNQSQPIPGGDIATGILKQVTVQVTSSPLAGNSSFDFEDPANRNQVKVFGASIVNKKGGNQTSSTQ